MNTTQDRRSHERLKIASAHQKWILSFGEPCEESLVSQVIDISKTGLCVRVHKSHLGELHGATLQNAPAFLRREQGSAHGIKVQIADIRTDFGTDTTYIHCHVQSEESRAVLWTLMNDIQGMEGLASPIHVTEAGTGAAPKIPERGIYSEHARKVRLQFIEEISGQKLEAIHKTQLPAHRLAGNIENHIGAVEVPLGLVGPLFFKGKNVSGHVYAPFATSEGALVASASRGSLLLSEAGGVTTRIISQRMIRVPMFVMDSLDSALFFSEWLRNHVNELQQAVKKVSSHAKLIEVDTTLIGRVVHASFVYSTGDAAGQNMTTAATWHACQWALSQAKYFKGVVIENFLIDSGLSGDKKVNFKSYIEGRGSKVVAEAFIPGNVLRRVMKVTPHELVTYYNSGLAALIQAGVIGSNINAANTIAAIFTATGQDIASVHESSLANLYVEEYDDGVYATMTLPSLIVGTVGGGAGLPTQSECLKIMDCFGAHKAGRLAEIIAGFCLALDLSTMSALVNGTFVKAHERLGRNRPIKWLRTSDVTREFFTSLLQKTLGDPTLDVIKSTETQDLSTTDSIITELTARNQEKLLGLFPYTLTYTSGKEGQTHQVDVILKSKPVDLEVIMLANKMAGMCNSALGDLYDRFKTRNESLNCHLKELAIYNQKQPLFVKNAPRLYGSLQDDHREAYVLVIERIENPLLMGQPAKPNLWTKPYIEAAIRGMAELHSLWLGKQEELKSQPWIGCVADAKSMAEKKALMREMTRHAALESPLIMTHDLLVRNYQLIDSVDTWWKEFDSMDQTLIHNDFNPRNIAIRGTPEHPELCAFDWELATIHVPQHDLAEFLTFVTTDATTAEELDSYLEFHRITLEGLTSKVLDKKTWRRGFQLSLHDLAINRLAMYLMAHTFKHYDFMEHIVSNNSRLIDLYKIP